MKITPARVIALSLLVVIFGTGWTLSKMKRARFEGVSGSVDLHVPNGFAAVVSADWAADPPILVTWGLFPGYPTASTELTSFPRQDAIAVRLPILLLEDFHLGTLSWRPRTVLHRGLGKQVALRNSLTTRHVEDWWNNGERDRVRQAIAADRARQERARKARLSVWKNSGRRVWLEIDGVLDPPGDFRERAGILTSLAEQLEKIADTFEPENPPPRRFLSVEAADLLRWSRDPSELHAPHLPEDLSTLPAEIRSIVEGLPQAFDPEWEFTMGPRLRRLRVQHFAAAGKFVSLAPRESLHQRLEGAIVELVRQWGSPEERQAIDRALSDFEEQFSETAFLLDPAPLEVTLQTLESLKRAMASSGQGKRFGESTVRVIFTSDPTRTHGWTDQEAASPRLLGRSEFVIPYGADPVDISTWYRGLRIKPRSLPE